MTLEQWIGMTWSERSKWASNAKRKYWRRVETAEKRDDARELNAHSIACLIEALIEMRPYLPEADV